MVFYRKYFSVTYSVLNDFRRSREGGNPSSDHLPVKLGFPPARE
jgi:hypothetical protein